MSFHSVTIGSQAPELLTVVIEIPKGQNFKYEWDEHLDVIRLDRVLHSPLFYPVDYGFVPETRSEDGDHLDVLVVVTAPSFPGCVMEVRPIGLLRMRDEKGLDYKVLAVPQADPRFVGVNRLEDLSAHIPREIRHFFEVYKTLEEKQVEVLGWYGLEEAYSEILRSMEAFKAPAASPTTPGTEVAP